MLGSKVSGVFVLRRPRLFQRLCFHSARLKHSSSQFLIHQVVQNGELELLLLRALALCEQFRSHRSPLLARPVSPYFSARPSVVSFPSAALPALPLYYLDDSRLPADPLLSPFCGCSAYSLFASGKAVQGLPGCRCSLDVNACPWSQTPRKRGTSRLCGCARVDFRHC